MVDEIDTDITRASVGSARSVCDSLSRNRALSQDQRAALMYAEAILHGVGEQLDEQNDPDDSDGKVIPVPADVMSDEAMRQVLTFVHGNYK